jgi:hypothetical protein
MKRLVLALSVIATLLVPAIASADDPDGSFVGDLDRRARALAPIAGDREIEGQAERSQDARSGGRIVARETP